MEKNRKKWSLFLFSISACFLILLDQITKIAAQKHLKGQDSFPIIKGVFELYYLENRGSAFGMLQGKKIFFIVTAVFVIIIIPYIYSKIPLAKRFRYLRMIAAMLLSGAAGNAIDRITRGYVIDFFYFSLIDFPVFNVADIYVTVGTFAFIILTLVYYKDADFEQIHLFTK